MSRNIRIIPDYPDIDSNFNTNAYENYDILILPGGAPGAKRFCSNPYVLSLVQDFCQSKKKWVAAICAATTVLVPAEKHKTLFFQDYEKCVVTSHPSVREEIEKAGWKYSEEVSF